MSNKAFGIGGYVGMEVTWLPQSVTNISLSKCQLIYEGRQCSLQTARHYVPGVINLRSKRWAIHVNRPLWIHAPAERPTFFRNNNTFRVLVIYFVIGLSLRTCRVCSCVGLCVRMIVSKEPLASVFTESWLWRHKVSSKRRPIPDDRCLYIWYPKNLISLA
jgi:hypothetical protein